MKQKIFNKGKGWYISCTNYKDKEDKCYMNVYFPYGEPEYKDNGRGYSVKDIDIEEAKFTSYKSKPGLTVFKYELLTDAEVKGYEINDSSMFGNNNDFIKSEDLPFY